MKTAISLPDPLFAQADLAAQELGLSRSEFYQRALTAYLRDRPVESLTERVNRFLDAHPESQGLEEGWASGQAAVLERDPW